MTPELPQAKKIDKCRLTGSDLLPVFDLGSPCVSDFLPPGTPGVHAPLCVAVAKEAPYLAQLTHSYPPEAMYRRYHYRSGTNEAMRAELADVVAKARRLRPIRHDKEVALDIACNDGTLLDCWREYPEHVWAVGIDPSDVAQEAYENGPGDWDLLPGFFSADLYNRHMGRLASIVTCVAMFYDIDRPVDFLRDVRAVMADDALFVLQVAYIPMHVTMGAWDYVGHEHLTAWDYNALWWALEKAGLSIVDAELTDSNGGSIRVYAMPTDAAKRFAGTPRGCVGIERCSLFELSEMGRHGGERKPAYCDRSIKDAWGRLAEAACATRAELLAFLTDAKARGKMVVGLGASTKGNSILQFCGITPDILPCIADRQEHKHGLVCAGSNIPIVSEAEMRRMKPDYLLALPWFFAETLKQREADLLRAGTKLVLPLPTLTVLD